MKKTILNAIFNGDLLPWEEKPIKSTKYVELQRKINLEREHFEEEMSPHEKGRFDQYHCLIQEKENMGIEATEYDLFMLGIATGIEIMQHKQSIMGDFDMWFVVVEYYSKGKLYWNK